MKRTVVLLLGVLALAAAACGGGDDEGSEGIPSLSETATAVPSTTAPLEADEALLVFSQCMRDEGIPLPDIAVDADGAPILDPSLLDVIDVESDEFTNAFEKCQPILARARAFDVDIDPELAAQIEDQFVTFSQCMRDAGFEDFPDPNPVGSGPIYPLSLLAQFDNPDFQGAVEDCQRNLAFPGLGGDS